MDELKSPTEEELNRLLDSDLSNCIEEMVQKLFNDAAQGKKIDDVLRVYMIYQAEYYKRGRLLDH